MAVKLDWKACNSDASSQQVGLLVGRLGVARDYLVFLVKTPPQVNAARKSANRVE